MNAFETGMKCKTFLRQFQICYFNTKLNNSWNVRGSISFQCTSLESWFEDACRASSPATERQLMVQISFHHFCVAPELCMQVVRDGNLCLDLELGCSFRISSWSLLEPEPEFAVRCSVCVCCSLAAAARRRLSCVHSSWCSASDCTHPPPP